MNETEALRPQLDLFQQRSLMVGMAAAALCLWGWFVNPDQFFRSYLLAFLFWIGIALGCFAVVMLHHLVGGGWGFVSRRLLESGTRTLPLMAVMFLPILFGLPHLYAWARPEELGAGPIAPHRSPYLNIPFFLVRTLFYFSVWMGIAHFLNKWSLEQDSSAGVSVSDRLQAASAPGLVVYGLTV